MEDTKAKKELELKEYKKAKQEKKEDKFKCKDCGVKLTTRINYCGHIDICLVKYKKIIEEKEKIIEKMIKDKKLEIEEMKKRWKIKKENLRVACSRVNNINVNNNLIILEKTDLSEKKLSDVFSEYGKNTFNEGSIGSAKFIQKKLLTNENGEITCVCTDISRNIFYNNLNGKVMKDPGLVCLYKKIHPWLKKENLRIFKEEMMSISNNEQDDNLIFMLRDRLILLLKDLNNKSRVIKRLAEISYVQLTSFNK